MKTSKKVLSIFLSLLLVALMLPFAAVPASALDAEGQCGDDVYWSFYSANGTLTIYGSGDMWPYDTAQPFAGNTDITRIIIEPGVTNIPQFAFRNCTALTAVVFLETAMEASTVASIGDYAFENCSSLISLTLPASVNNIDVYAFWNCTGLAGITVSPDNEKYGSINGVLINKQTDTMMKYPAAKVGSEYTIPDGVTKLGWYVFEHCQYLETLNIPAAVTKMFWETSYGTVFTVTGCPTLINMFVSEDNTEYSDKDGVLFSKDGTKLLYYPHGRTATEYRVPNSVTRIDEEAFSGVQSLTSIVIPSSVTTVSQYAFSNAGLTDIYFIGEETDWNITVGSHNDPFNNATVHYLEGGACGATSADDVYWMFNPDTGVLTVYGIGDMEDYMPLYQEIANPDTVTSIVVEEGVTQTGVQSFSALHSVQTVSLPSTLTFINDYTFEHCYALESIDIPAGVTGIGDQAFDGCTGLTNIIIPEGVESIGGYAFTDCNNLVAVTLPSTLEFIGDGAFYPCDNLLGVTMYPGDYNEIDYYFIPHANNDDVFIYFVGTQEQAEAISVKNSPYTDDGSDTLAGSQDIRYVTAPYATVSVRETPDCFGRLASVEGAGQYQYGAFYTVTPIPAANCTLGNWYLNGIDRGEGESYSGFATTQRIRLEVEVNHTHTWNPYYDANRSCNHQYIGYGADGPQRGDVINIQYCSGCEALRLYYQGITRPSIVNELHEDYVNAIERLTVHYDPNHDCVCDDCETPLAHIDDDNDYHCDNCGTVMPHDCVDANSDCVCDLCGEPLEHTWSFAYDTTPRCDGQWVDYPENTTFVSADVCDVCNAVRIHYTEGDPRIVAAADVPSDAEIIDLTNHMGQPAHDWHFVYDTTPRCDGPYIDYPENTTFASAESCYACGAVRIHYTEGDPRFVAAADVPSDAEVLDLDAHMKQHVWRFVYDTTPSCEKVWINYPEMPTFASAEICDLCGNAQINYTDGTSRIVAADDIASDAEIIAIESHIQIHGDTELRGVVTANCQSGGYTGDLYCLLCNTPIEMGEATPVDPTNHPNDDGDNYCDLCGMGLGVAEGYTLLPTADGDALADGDYWFDLAGFEAATLAESDPSDPGYNELLAIFNNNFTVGLNATADTLRIDTSYQVVLKNVFTRDDLDSEVIFSYLHQHGAAVEVVDSTTGVTASAEAGVIPANTVLVVVPDAPVANIEIADGTLDNYNHEAYDVTLQSGGVEVQPQGGTVTVKLPIPAGFDKTSIVVYYVDDNGNKTDMNATVEGDFAVFTVEHFSTYVMVDTNCLHNGETEIRDAVEANCHVEGYTGDTYCKICGNKIATGTNTGKDTSKHDGETEIRNAKAATCKADGYTGDTWCKGCNTKIATGATISKDTIAHTPGAVVKENVVEATTDHGGSYDEVVRCTVCNKVLSSTHKTTDKLPSQPQPDPNMCHWCGQVHEGFFQKIIGFFHRIFAAIFGARY